MAVAWPAESTKRGIILICCCSSLAATVEDGSSVPEAPLPPTEVCVCCPDKRLSEAVVDDGDKALTAATADVGDVVVVSAITDSAPGVLLLLVHSEVFGGFTNGFTGPM